MALSQRVQRVKPSATLAVAARARELKAEGRDVISLGTGEPDFPTPRHIGEAAARAIEAGDTHYTAVDGTDAIKQAIRDKFRRDNGLDYEADQIIVSCGAKHSLFNLMQATLDPGDEVIVPAPYWVSYPDMARLADANPVELSADLEADFKITPAQLAGALTDKTRLLILNSPSNPTGKAYSEAELKALGEVLAEHPRVAVVSDEIYEHLYWGEEPFVCFATACPQLAERTVIVNGVSKAYAMTGWRIGYAAGPQEWIAAMKKIQSQSTTNASSIAQAAAVAALAGDQQCVRDMTAEFHRRHDRVVAALDALPGVTCPPCDGAFYAFPSFAGAIRQLDGIEDDLQLAEWLLEQADVALVPGTAFGAPGHLRVSYATSLELLERAIERIGNCLRENGVT